MSAIADARRLPPIPGRLIAKERRLPYGTAPDNIGGEIAGERRLNKASGAETFGLGIRAAGRILWRGEGAIGEFIDTIDSAVRRGYERAWQEGAAACKVLPADRTLEERNTLDGFIMTAQLHYMGLADFLMDNSRANGGKWGSVLPRLAIWTNRYAEVRETAQQMSCGDTKTQWVLGPTEHCRDCLRLSDRIYRNSIWAKYNIRPQMRSLACGGWRCQCRLVPTDEPVTPGRPPNIP
jgi:hypothetical protein